MAEIKKTSIRRYNGTDWDIIYLATTSDIVTLGTALTVANETTGWTVGDTIAANTGVNALLNKIINRIQYNDNTVLPAIIDGSSITALAASKLTGTVDYANLPSDVHGNVKTGVTDSGKDDSAFVATLKVGDIVKTTEGKVYGVQAISGSTVTWVALSDDAASVTWSRITGRPTTVTNDSADASDASKLYLTNVVLTGDLVETASVANAGKVMKINAAGKLDTSITGDADTVDGHDADYFATQSWADGIDTAIGTDSTAGTIKGRITDLETWQGNANTALNLEQVIAGTGTLPLTVIPKGAQERLYEVSAISVLADSSAAGYPTEASNGDTIQDQSDGKMYYVTDETKLGTVNYAQGIHVYTAGTASSVEWANVQNKPTTIDGYGITDAVYANEKVTTASAANEGKILVLNAAGKLDVDITGDANTLDGHDSGYFATASGLSDLSDAIGTDATAGTVKYRIAQLENTVGDATDGLVKQVADIEDAIGNSSTSGTIIYRLDKVEDGSAIQALAASKLTGTVSRGNLPEDVSGKVWPASGTYADLAAAETALAAAENVNKGDLVKLADGKVYMVTDTTSLASAAGYTIIVDPASPSVAWSQLTGIPTTIIKSGTAAAGEILLTNAIITDDVVATAINSTTDAGDTSKSGKIVKVDTDGKVHADVTHLGGHAAQYYEFLEVSSTSDVSNAVEGQMVLIPATT